MIFRNLCPHPVTIIVNGEARTLENGGPVARCSEHTSFCGEIDGIPIIKRVYGNVENLPEPEAGVAYIVSGLVRMAVGARTDVFSPGDAVRDSTGTVVATVNLIANPYWEGDNNEE